MGIAGEQEVGGVFLLLDLAGFPLVRAFGATFSGGHAGHGTVQGGGSTKKAEADLVGANVAASGQRETRYFVLASAGSLDDIEGRGCVSACVCT